jgi:hypothetical protein
MRHFKVLIPQYVCFVIILVAASLFSTTAGAVLQTFSGPWDPTKPFNGFSLRATQTGSTATMTLGEDHSSLTIDLALNNCHHGCGAFYLDNSTGLLPHGHVQFDWTLAMNDYTSDGQIGIDGVDPNYNSGHRDAILYPFVLSGSADIDYEGGTFTIFNLGIGAEWTGSTTATLSLIDLSAPDALIQKTGPNSTTTTRINEPAGWGVLLLAGMVVYRVRRSPGRIA